MNLIAFVTLVVLMSVLAIECKLSASLRLHLWNNFKKSHGKHYLSEEHDLARQQIFNSNLDHIEKHNNEYSLGLHSYTLGVNAFADWTFQEFREKMLGTRLNMTHRKDASMGTFVKLPKSVTVADAVDWREEGAVTPVKNQGQVS